MTRLRVIPIVEGHGEDSSIRILLQRIWSELLGGDYLDVVKPIRSSRGKLVHGTELGRAIDLAALKLKTSRPEEPGVVLVLVDADEDLPCRLGPDMLVQARQRRPDADVSCVVANVEYETWFVAAAESLDKYLDLSGVIVPEDPEGQRAGKAWVQKRYRGRKYSETVDQPAMTTRMDIAQCRRRSRSFDKLCRELEERLSRTS